jgi:hypothetical protein
VAVLLSTGDKRNVTWLRGSILGLGMSVKDGRISCKLVLVHKRETFDDNFISMLSEKEKKINGLGFKYYTDWNCEAKLNG